MKIELNDEQLKIIQKALRNAIERYVGISKSQEVFLNNIDHGMSKKEAEKQFEIDNRKEWEHYVHEEKNSLYCLYDYIFRSPASFRG